MTNNERVTMDKGKRNVDRKDKHGIWSDEHKR